MKTRNTITLAIFLIIAIAGCKKAEDKPVLASGAINLTNAVIGGGTLTLTTNYNVISAANTINNNASVFLPVVAGQTQINLGVQAVAATVTTPTIPAVTYYSNTLSVTSQTNYSLFLTGASPSSVESVLIDEKYSRTYADSLCGVRFINLSPNSNPISVNIKGNPNGSEALNLAYKAYSGFVQHIAKRANASYIFEFRDAATGNLITSYSLTTPYFHNVTLALRGTVGGSVGVILNNDY